MVRVTYLDPKEAIRSEDSCMPVSIRQESDVPIINLDKEIASLLKKGCYSIKCSPS